MGGGAERQVGCAVSAKKALPCGPGKRYCVGGEKLFFRPGKRACAGRFRQGICTVWSACGPGRPHKEFAAGTSLREYAGSPRSPGHRLQGFAGAVPGLTRAPHLPARHKHPPPPGEMPLCGRWRSLFFRPGNAHVPEVKMFLCPKRSKTPANGLTSCAAHAILYKLFSKTVGAFCIKGLFPPAEKREVIRYLY